MEIGILALFILTTLSICFVEKTRIGGKVADWALKNFCGIDTNNLEG